MTVLFPDGHWHFSPVWVFRVTPLQNGTRTLEVDFFHANYPEGVQGKSYKLRIARRSEGFVLANRDELIVIFQKIDWDWLKQHFAYLTVGEQFTENVDELLDRKVRRPGRYPDLEPPQQD